MLEELDWSAEGNAMLIKYAVSNFKSIGHKIEFNMLPSSLDVDERLVKHINTQGFNGNILQRACFLGSNASGKSSFIESIFWSSRFITGDLLLLPNICEMQFKGNLPELNGMSSFSFTFFVPSDVSNDAAPQSSIFEYGFALDPDSVREEWLYKFGANQEKYPLYERLTDVNGQTQVEISNRFTEGLPQEQADREFQLSNVLISGLKKNQLFLYKLFDSNVSTVVPVFNWFNEITCIFPSTKFQALPITVDQDPCLKKFISRSLKELDTGIDQIVVERQEMSIEEFFEITFVPNEIKNAVRASKTGMFETSGKLFIVDSHQLWQIRAVHKLTDVDNKFVLDDESEGTKRLFDILPILFAVRAKRCGVFLIDELDRCLHSKISKFLLHKFLENNLHHCQLICTTHDVNLMDLSELIQDEIWFIDKSYTGESKLKPLSNFKLEQGQDVLKAYLCGRFGGVPVIRL